MKRYILILTIAVAFAAVITYSVSRSIVTGRAASVSSHSHAEEGENEHSKVVDGIRLEPVAIGESWDVVEATGKVGANSNKLVKIGPRIAGRAEAVRVDIGDTVFRGQTLATISSVELAQARAAYRQATARLQAAEQAYENQKRLAHLGAFSNRPVEEARGEHAAAQGDLAQARSELAQNRSDLARAEVEAAQCAARLERARDLYKDQIISKQDLEGAEAEHKRDSAEVDLAKSRIRQTDAKIEQLKARAAIADGQLEREQKVQSGNLLSGRELQAARAEVTAAKLEVQAAADTIRVLGASPGGSGDTLAITSPISGRIAERNVSLGEMVEPSSALFTVLDLSDVWVEANIYEKDLARVRKGQPVEIHVSGYPERTFQGSVALVGDVLDAASRTARVRCSVSNPGGMLKPEMFVTARIVTAKRDGAVLVPRSAVLDEGAKKIVFTACTCCAGGGCGDYDKREVELGTAQGGRVEVTSGLKPGERVVVEGQHQLKTELGSGKPQAGCADEH